MIRNERAAGDSRHARTGKDGAFYSEDGVLLGVVVVHVRCERINCRK